MLVKLPLYEHTYGPASELVGSDLANFAPESEARPTSSAFHSHVLLEALRSETKTGLRQDRVLDRLQDGIRHAASIVLKCPTSHLIG